MDTIAQDLRYAFRRLARSPGFAAVAVLSLSLGIGANTAIFSVVDAVLMEDPPFEAPEELVEIYTSDSGGFEYATSSYLDYVSVREEASDVFSDMTAQSLVFLQTEGSEGSELLMGEMVTHNYFSVLGVEPMLGRAFLPEEGSSPGTHPVVILSQGFWESRYGGDPGVIGATLRLIGKPYTIIGVAPGWFKGSTRGLVPDVWVPMMMATHLDSGFDVARSSRLENRSHRGLWIKGRLRPGATYAQAGAAVETVSRQLAEAYPDTNEGRIMSVLPTQDVAIHPLVDRALVPVAGLLLTVVGLVLVIACANLASFLLARAADRRKEIAVRLALGAKRRDLIRQLMTETLVLALLGGGAGLLVAHWTIQGILGFQPPLPISVNLDLGLDTTVLLFTLGISLASGLVFGLAPAIQSTNPDVTPTLKDEGRHEAGGHKRLTLRNALVVTQVAVSLVLLVASGLFLRSLGRTQEVNPGFELGNGALVWANLAPLQVDEAEGRALFETLRARLEALPGTQSVTLADLLPLGAGVQTRGVEIPGVDPPAGEDDHGVDFRIVDQTYFDALEIPITRGRAFGTQDGPGGAPVVMVSEAFVQRFWPGHDPVDEILRMSNEDYRVVGVAANTKVRTLGEPPRPLIYQPFSQSYSAMMHVVVRSESAEAQALAAVRATIREVDAGITLLTTATLSEHLSLLLFAPRMGAILLSVFGGLALILATVGLYGVVSHVVARRTREVGIRMSLGADARRVVALVMKGGMSLVGVGALIGLGVAFGAGQLMSGFLFGVSGTDPLTFVGIPVLLLAVAALAAFIPARRASRVNPVTALRSE